MEGTRAFGPPPLPHEHGAWAMLAIPLLLGFAAAGRPVAATLLLVPSMTLLFLARFVAVPAAARVASGKASPPGYLRRRAAWTSVYLAGSAAGFAFAWAAAEPPARPGALAVGGVILVLGTVHASLALARWDRTLGGEVVGMAGLAGGAPLVMAFAGRPPDGQGAGLALLCLSYFLSTVAFVRAFSRLKADRRAAIAACLLSHAGIGAAIASLWAAGWIPAAATLAFVPALLRTAWGLASPPENVRALGWREAWVASAFAAIAFAALVV